MRRPRRTALDTELRRTAWRIGLQTAGLLVVCLLLVGAVAYAVVVRSQERQLLQSLTDASATAGLVGGRDLDHDHDLSEPRGGIQYAVLDPRGLRSSTELPPGMPDLATMHRVATTGAADRRTVTLATGAYEVLTVRRGDDTVQVVASRFEQHQERERILGALGLAGGTGLVLATLAAAVLARRAVRPMAQALALQRRFVADAGHELRTPLTLLSTRAQLLARRVRGWSADGATRPTGPGTAGLGTAGPRTAGLGTAGPETVAERIVGDADGIVADTAALTAILEELLLAADVRTPVPREPVDVGTLVAGAVASARARAERAGLDLTVGVLDPPTLRAGAPTALGRAVTAMIDNALDHAAGGVAVTVTTRGRNAVVQVSDDGPGIPADTLPRMFERFASGRPEPTQVPLPTPTPLPAGVATGAGDRRHFGLGLALVSEIAARHGGTVTATNRPAPGSGAVLELLLPL